MTLALEESAQLLDIQYSELKACSDTDLLVCRNGDHYEFRQDDARIVAGALGIEDSAPSRE